MDETPVRLGPLVRRSVHHGSILWFLGTLQFLVLMALVESVEPGPYSLSQNVISDLGNTGCGGCGPYPLVFNASIVAFGVLVVLGAILVQSAFPPKRGSQLGVLLVAVAGAGAAGVGAMPENVYHAGHVVAAFLVLFVGALSLVVLSVAMLRDTRWTGFRAYTLISGLVGLVAFALFATQHDVALGPGGWERLAVAPTLLWLLIASIHLLYIPTFAPKKIPDA